MYTCNERTQFLITGLFCNLQEQFFTMSDSAKAKIYKMLEGIEDENILNQVMEDVAFYASKKDITDGLTPEQLQELDKAIQEADNKDTISWEDFKKEMNEWRKK